MQKGDVPQVMNMTEASIYWRNYFLTNYTSVIRFNFHRAVF
ncbi:hypothetical protein PAXY110619_28460 [Paenibacillus xylanexedens]|uniref:Uncharacterized protein n=1 Tax=Paenibacillus xylanexedens TaxID=528191 RepID=A0ABS4S174_PAEXY|nr:hypothetical protein [Paenibacillus xylanexedens]